MKRILHALTAVLCSAFLAACGSDSATAAKVSLNMVSSSATTGSRADLFRVWAPFSRIAPHVGSNTAAQLESLKYIFGFISICEGLTTTGSAFSNPTGCIQIYSGPVIGDGSSGAITPATFADHAASQIDLMSATSRANLNSSYTLTASDARSYQWAVVNWYTPIGVKATVTTTGSNTLVTKAATSYDGTSNFAVVPDMSTGAAEEAVIVSPNGGSFFHFQTPFVVTAADITAGTTYVVDMAFNPTGVISANSNNAGTPTGSPFLHHSALNQGIYVPMLSLVPVPRKSTDTSKKEVYSVLLGSNRGTTRVELYYAASDTAKTITGVNLITVLADTDISGSYAQIDNGSKIASVTVATDGSVTLTDNGAPPDDIIKGLTRRANGNVDIKWIGGIGGAGEAGVAYTYDGTVEVN